MGLQIRSLVSAPNRINLLILSLFISSCIFFSAIIPPFQSPDEFDHIKRAYFLSQGIIVLDRPEGKSSGGMIDTGLSDYMEVYFALLSKQAIRKLSNDMFDTGKNIDWTGVKEFSPAPGASYYFPIIYMPQAIGLAIGEKCGFKIDTSYQLARIVTLASIAVILFAAFSIYPVNHLTIALLIIPMSFFQFSSASLDGLSTALSILSIASFLRIATEQENACSKFFYALAVSVILLASSRVHLLPLLMLVFAACFYTKKNKHFIIFIFSVVSVFIWLLIALKTTVDLRVVKNASTFSIAQYYIINPLIFFDILWTTLSNSDLVEFYSKSFLGILGWLDARFSLEIYKYLSIFIALIGFLSISFKNIRIEWRPRAILVLSAFVSVLLIFFALLITWTTHPASNIQGVQGRYFLIPMIMLAYAISGDLSLCNGFLKKITLVLVISLWIFSIINTTTLLLGRYYLATEQPKINNTVKRPSAPLEKNKFISVKMSSFTQTCLKPLRSISILFGTHSRTNTGIAELRLTTLNGNTLRIPFDLSTLIDNEYKHFVLNSLPYSSGKIISKTGSGISTWEAHEYQGAIATCLIYEYTNGSKLYTPGCPRLEQ